MNKFFPGYYPVEGDASTKMWENCVIVLDSSFLLALFTLRYEEADRILKLFEKESIKSKLWMPYDEAWHYHRFVNNVIQQQISAIDRLSVLLQEALALTTSEISYPYFNAETMSKFSALVKVLKTGNDAQKSDLKDCLYRCNLKQRIDALFDGKVGSSYDISQLDELYKQGEKRYTDHIPPGFSTSDYEEKRLKYHDLIVWEQFKKEAMNNKKNLIMCSANPSSDWFYLVDSEPITSNCHLVNEFYEDANQIFRCFTLKYFLLECKEHGLISDEEYNTVGELTLNFKLNSNDSAMTTQSSSSVQR